MILVDANLLVSAWNGDDVRHEAARDWLQSRLGGVEGVGLPWASLLAFVRLTSNPRIFPTPARVSDAWQQVQEWLARPNVFVPEPAARHAAILGTLVPVVDRAHLVPDAHLAALAMGYGLILCSTDRDFARFPGLRWMDPLAG